MTNNSRYLYIAYVTTISHYYSVFFLIEVFTANQSALPFPGGLDHPLSIYIL